MTVVAYRDGVLAADQQLSVAGTKSKATKIWQHEGAAIAITGAFSFGYLMRKWYMDGEDLSAYPESQKSDSTWARLIVLHPTKGLYIYEDAPVPVTLDPARYHAWGSGREVAIGAMFRDAGAETAVMAAIEHSEGCGFGVTAYHVPRH